MARELFIDEVRRVREDLAAKNGFDIKAILMAEKDRQRPSSHKMYRLHVRSGRANKLSAAVTRATPACSNSPQTAETPHPFR
jgi:hypothetical protein